MKKKVAIAIVGSLVLFSGSAGATDRALPEARVMVRLYDQAELDAGTLERARQISSKVFRLAGVEIDWVACSVDGTESKPICAKPLGPNEISVRILERSASRKGTASHAAGAHAFQLPGIKGAGFISLFQDRLKTLPVDKRVHIGTVLGYVMAHEIGHILLPPNSHSRAGLMKAVLGRAEWAAASMGGLNLTSKQRRIINRRVLSATQS